MVRLANIQNITNALTGIKNHVFEYFLIGTNKKGSGKYPLARLKLDIIGEETLSADCDVTDHYVESNTAYQDQISLKPKIFTIQGEVGELVWYQKDQDEQGLGQVAQRLEGVISFLPIRSKSFNQMKHKAMKALQWVDTASNVISKLNTLSDGLGNGKQQSAFSQLCQYRDERSVLTIQTPWGFLEGYVITNLKFTQPKETKDKTFVSITFKELRTTSIKTVPFDSSKYQANASFENEPLSKNGKTSGQEETIVETTKEGDDFIPLEYGNRSFTCNINKDTFMIDEIIDNTTGKAVSDNDPVWDNYSAVCADDVEKAIANSDWVK
jgi:hypothetical protein